VQYHGILASRPASADGLSIPLGIGENKKPIYKSLGQMYSMMIAGTIGGGKSNILNVIICTLIRTNSPKRLRFMLIDLKGGVEFSFYEGVPHLLGVSVGQSEDGTEQTVSIIDRRELVPKALDYLIREGERRMGMLRESRCKGIGEYNFEHRAKPLAHICCVIDEWADVTLDRAIGASSEEKLINIASRFRAAGIHVLLCTQVPKKEVIDMRIKNVLPARLAFACPDIHASMLILGDGKAHGLEPAGRSIFQWGNQTFELQTPFISNKIVDETVAGAISGEYNDVDSSTHDVTEQEILEWAITMNAGKLDRRSVYAKFKTRGIQEREVRSIIEQLEGTTVVIGSTPYTIERGSGAVATRLLPLTEDDPDEPA
jgi:S-DNA-T family DNA segregation ATPase FtsK/SpoIIIE